MGDKNQSVYIYGCGAAVIDVRGKGKSVVLDSCKRTQARLVCLYLRDGCNPPCGAEPSREPTQIRLPCALSPTNQSPLHAPHHQIKSTQVLVDEMISSLEVVNCQRVKLQVQYAHIHTAFD